MKKWEIPNWGEPWEPEFEVPILKELAELIEELDRSVKCEPDFEVEGCAFIQLFRNKQNIGRICVAKHETGVPFYSGYFGETDDEFQGFNREAVANTAIVYKSELPND